LLSIPVPASNSSPTQEKDETLILIFELKAYESIGDIPRRKKAKE
jgi:hypothetical protein